jgi:hypothetical protein
MNNMTFPPKKKPEAKMADTIGAILALCLGVFLLALIVAPMVWVLLYVYSWALGV